MNTISISLIDPSTPAPIGTVATFAGRIVGNGHHSTAASSEQPIVHGVDGLGDRLLALGVEQRRALTHEKDSNTHAKR